MGLDLIPNEHNVAVNPPDVEQFIHTSCEKCIFGIWETLEQKEEQIGCKFARLDKFKANGGLNLIKLDKDGSEICEEKDVVLEYYKIPRFCNYCRDGDWKEQQEKNSNLFELVIEESKIQFTFIIYTDKNTKYIDVQSIVNLINLQEQKPTEVILVNNKNTLNDKENIAVLDTLVCPWRRIYIGQEDAPMNFALDESYRYVKTHFIGEFRVTPPSLPTNVISNLEDIINNKLERVLAISYKSIPGFNIFQTKLVKLLSGNTRIEFHKDGKVCEGVYDKLKYFIEQQNKPEYIREYE